MTVIVFDGVHMAADSGQLMGNVVDVCPTPKIVRLRDGSLVGASGLSSDCYVALRWFLDETRLEMPVFLGKAEDRCDVDILMAKPDGTLWRNGHGLRNFFPVPVRTAIGDRDAGLVAQTVLQLGGSAAYAIEIAIQMCASIIGPIQIEKLNPITLAAAAE